VKSIDISSQMSGHKVYFSTPKWHISGVNSMSARLISGLSEMGFDARAIFTELGGQDPPSTFLELEVPFHNIQINHSVWSLQKRWRPLINFLVKESPCIFVPNYDFAAAVISPVLPNEVGVVGAIRSDEYIYFEQAKRLGKSWNRIVVVSEALAHKTKEAIPEIADKVTSIPNGVSVNSSQPLNAPQNDKLRLLYTGRVSIYQKRINDILRIAETLNNTKLDFVLDIAGDGPDFSTALEFVQSKNLAGKVNMLGRLHKTELEKAYQNADVFLLVSEFEGMPNSLLEAMSWGCVPVCSRTSSGASEVISNGRNGFLRDIGDVSGFVNAITSLADRELRERMRIVARRTIEGSFSFSSMTDKWAHLLDDVRREILMNQFPKRSGVMKHCPGFKPSEVLIAEARIRLGLLRRRFF
jgi:glycosyltransferase involved in cell wall biosynthesis